MESLRFDTMPSSPSLQAWAKTVGPSPSICSLNRMPGAGLGHDRCECGLADLKRITPQIVCVVASPGPPSQPGGSRRLDGPTSSDAQDYLSNARTTVKNANSFFAIHLHPATVELCRFKCRAASNADGSRGAVA